MHLSTWHNAWHMVKYSLNDLLKKTSPLQSGKKSLPFLKKQILFTPAQGHNVPPLLKDPPPSSPCSQSLNRILTPSQALVNHSLPPLSSVVLPCLCHSLLPHPTLFLHYNCRCHVYQVCFHRRLNFRVGSFPLDHTSSPAQPGVLLELSLKG